MRRTHQRSSSVQSRLPLPWIIAWRYLRGRRSQMLASTAMAALFATTLGVVAMVLAMALMSGYTSDLKRRLIGLQGEIIASPLDQSYFAEHRDALERAASLPDVQRMGLVSYGEGSLSSPQLQEGVSIVLRGVDPDADPVVRQALQNNALQSTAQKSTAQSLQADERGVSGILLGPELVRQLAIEPGDALRLVVLDISAGRPRFRYRSVRFAGTFSTGFAEFDATWVLLDRQLLRQLRGSSGLDVVEFKLRHPDATESVTRDIEELLGGSWLVHHWLSLNRELFAALQLQEALLFLVLGLIVVVSTFNVASTLVILVREKMRDVGVLGAMGLAPRQIARTIIVYGLGLGAFGTLLGVLIGVSTAWVITEFELVRFDPEVAAIYFIDSVPFLIESKDLMAIIGFSLGVTLIACLLPARRAARLQPSTALRME